ncbi:hypothetical protein AALA44_11060 [Enterococcus ratti]|uniref:hypothetical protein n=1 Tax=Enterococcus ratti TaxID=150033 RepID=UPI0035128B46
MKLCVWCLTVLTSFFLGMFVMCAFNIPQENDHNEPVAIKITNMSNSSTQEAQSTTRKNFNGSLKEAIETYQNCYMNQCNTPVMDNKTVNLYSDGFTVKNEEKEYNLEFSTEINKTKTTDQESKKKQVAYYQAVRRKAQYQKFKKFIESY